MKTLSTERSLVSPARPPASDAAVTPPVPLTLTRPGHQPRPKPPRHLADLDLAARRAAVADLGEPPFRAVQLSRHFFSRYTERPDDMSDLPRASRAALAGALLPPLLTAERELVCDDGTTRKTLWRGFDGALKPRHSVLRVVPSSQTSSRSAVSSGGSRAPASAAREARGRSLMSSGRSVYRLKKCRDSWTARKGGSPRSATAARRAARSRSARCRGGLGRGWWPGRVSVSGTGGVTTASLAGGRAGDTRLRSVERVFIRIGPKAACGGPPARAGFEVGG